MAQQLIREALHPYTGIVVATKAGLAQTGPDQWTPLGRPEYLIQQAYTSCRRLGVEHIDLWQLRRIDPRVPRAEQFDGGWPARARLAADPDCKGARRGAESGGAGLDTEAQPGDDSDSRNIEGGAPGRECRRGRYRVHR